LGKHQGVPQVDEQGAVDVVSTSSGALTKHDLVYAARLISVRELEPPVGLGPVQLRGKAIVAVPGAVGRCACARMPTAWVGTARGSIPGTECWSVSYEAFR
jgi:hypothetical protein